MVKAILGGRKTVTRRLVKPQPTGEVNYIDGYVTWSEDGINKMQETSPYKIKDILYVRETWSEWTDGYVYKVPDNKAGYNYPASYVGKWKPSIHMPKEAARIFLKVKDVRVERLQDITEKDACKEGFHAGCTNVTSGPWGLDDCPEEWTAREEFSELWNSTINKQDIVKYGWDANPWVWVIEFERISKEEAYESYN